MKNINLLSGGAAQGLVTQLEDRFEALHQCSIDASFGAVGMMKDSLLAGAPCDVIILTEALIQQLAASGAVLASTVRALGVVKTGVAVKTGDASPAVGTPEALKAALQAARGIYFPDPVKSTAGIHFKQVLQQLGLDAELSGRLHPFPNGATAMTAMAEADGSAMGIQVYLGDTALTPEAGSSSATRQTFFTGNAVRLAAAELKHILMDVAGHLLPVHPEDLVVVDGAIIDKEDPTRRVSFHQLLAEARRPRRRGCLRRCGGSAG